MKKFLIAVAVMYASLVQAQEPRVVGRLVAANTNVEILEAPCTDPAVLEQIPPFFRPMAKYARGTFEGQPHKVCWIDLLGQDSVVLQWEDGWFKVRRNAFKDEGS